MNLPVGTVTFLCTDVENSTELWEAAPEAMALALARHDTLLKNVVETNKGVVFKPVGDGFYTVFASPHDAMNAAIEAQERLLAEPTEESRLTLRVRMGLHIGTPECRDGDYFGPALSRLARVCNLGHGGQILMTRAVYELVRDLVPKRVTFRSLDAWRLKGMSRPETIYQVEYPGLPSDFPSLRSVAENVGNLPDLLSTFVGREAKVQQIAERLDAQKLLTLRGAGGCGKTRLAIEACRPLAIDYPGGVWLVRLDSLNNAELIPSETTRTLRLYVPPGQTVEHTLMNRLREQSALLILDNCEHLRTGCAHFAHELLANCPDLRILATSREPLGVPGEQVLEVPPLRVPKRSVKPSLSAVRASEAVQLFTARAEAASGFALTRENAFSVAEICRALDGIPLALELAARWVGILPLTEIAHELSELINESPDDLGIVPARQQTMRATVDWSYNRLQPEEQALFLNLSVFVGGFTLEAARAIITAENQSATYVLRLLKGLVERSLVFFDQHAHPDPRYRLLEPVREVAVEKLAKLENAEAAHKQHQNWCRSYATRADTEIQGSEQTLWLDRLEAEHDNLREALKWTVDPRIRLHLAVMLHRFWRIHGHYAEGRAWLENALAQAVDVNELERAKALNAIGILAWMQGDMTAALHAFQETLTIYQNLNSQAEVAMILSNLGILLRSQGKDEEAISHFETSLSFYRLLDDKKHVSIVLNNLASTYLDCGKYTAAESLLEECLSQYGSYEDPANTAAMIFNLGEVALNTGRLRLAMTRYQEAMTTFWNLKELSGIGLALCSMARAERLSHNCLRAASLLGAVAGMEQRGEWVLSIKERRQYEEDLAAVREVLTEADYNESWNQGFGEPLAATVSSVIRDQH